MFDITEQDEPELPTGMGCELCGPDSNCPPCTCDHCRARRTGAQNAAIDTGIALGRYDDCLARQLFNKST